MARGRPRKVADVQEDIQDKLVDSGVTATQVAELFDQIWDRWLKIPTGRALTKRVVNMTDDEVKDCKECILGISYDVRTVLDELSAEWQYRQQSSQGQLNLAPGEED